jgi:hypothetical protein
MTVDSSYMINGCPYWISTLRWGRDRAEAVLHLRCVLINGMWDDFETHLATLHDFKLRNQPRPTRTHDAVMKQAA